MASLTPQVNSNFNSALAGGLSNVTPSGSANAYFQPTQVFNPAPVNNTNVASALLGKGPLVASGQSSLNAGAPKVTSLGGATFTPPTASPSISQTQSESKPDLMSFLNRNVATPGGGTATFNGNNISGYTAPPNYKINTGNIDSSHLNGSSSMSDLASKYGTYSDYFNALQQANGYSPAYQQAYGNQNQAQFNQAQVPAALNSPRLPQLGNYLNNPGAYSGDTQGYAQAVQGQESAAAGVQSTEANIAMGVQQLARQGNIAQAQVGFQNSPTVIAAQQAMGSYNSLAAANPSANLPPFDPNQDPIAQLNLARQQIAQSPAFQSQFQSTYATPGGGTGIYNKLNSGQLPQSSDGTLSLVSGAAAASGGSAATNYNALATQVNNLSVPYKAANDDFSAMTKFMQQAGINDANLPIANQIKNKINAGILNPGAQAEFQTYIQSLRAKYTQLLGAVGETPTDAGNNATTLIPTNLNIADMQKIQEGLNTNGKNIIDATQSRAQQLYQSLQTGQPQSAPNLGGTQTGNIYDF